jgi:ferritin
MMTLISEEFNKALNKQIKEELESGYLYLSMSYWLKEQSFNNLANWYDLQAQEEYEHAMKFANYIVETGGEVELLALSKPKKEWESVEEIVHAGFKHEQYITKKIHELVELADELKEYSVKSLLQWFVDEQVEEEATAQEMIDRQAAFKNNMLFDQHTTRVSEEEEEE